MIVLPAILESIRSLKDRTYKLTFETSELTPEQLTGVGGAIQKYGYLAFSEKELEKQALDIIDKVNVDYEDKGKSKAQRLRGVLYRCFEQDSKGYEVFDDYYNYQMEKLIIHFKNKLS